LRWIAEIPAVFRATPAGIDDGTTPVDAVVGDLFETLFDERPAADLLQAFRPAANSKAEQNRLHWVLTACHLLWHPALRSRALPRQGLRKLLIQELSSLAAVVPVDRLLDDEERREELIRRVFAELALRLPGETARDSEDRLAQVDSLEQRRLLKAAADKEKRVREVREMMARRAAEEAAAKTSRE
jgi:hypothetical protein